VRQSENILKLLPWAIRAPFYQQAVRWKPWTLRPAPWRPQVGLSFLFTSFHQPLCLDHGFDRLRKSAIHQLFGGFYPSDTTDTSEIGFLVTFSGIITKTKQK